MGTKPIPDDTTAMMSGRPTRVLVVGPRRGLLRALAGLKVPFVVWTDRNRSYRHADYVHVAPIAIGEDTARNEAEALKRHGAFTHVIAGNEAAVMPAAVARRSLGARQSPRTMVLRCHDKLRMKQHLRDHEIAMTRFMNANIRLDSGQIVERLGLPVVVKPRRSSGGRGMEIVSNREHLDAVSRRGRLFERYVDAPEVSVESFVNRGALLFENVTEYAQKAHVNVVPAGVDDATREAVLALNRRVLDALNISWGMTHAEFYLTHRGPLFGEIALRPPGGYIMELLRLAWGFDAWAAFAAIELDRAFEFPDTCQRHTAAMVLHPGAGRVAAIRGLDRVESHPAAKTVRLRVKPGDTIDERPGVGTDVGHILLQAATRTELDGALAFVDSHLEIELENQSSS